MDALIDILRAVSWPIAFAVAAVNIARVVLAAIARDA